MSICSGSNEICHFGVECTTHLSLGDGCFQHNEWCEDDYTCAGSPGTCHDTECSEDNHCSNHAECREITDDDIEQGGCILCKLGCLEGCDCQDACDDADCPLQTSQDTTGRIMECVLG